MEIGIFLLIGLDWIGSFIKHGLKLEIHVAMESPKNKSIQNIFSAGKFK